MSILRYSHSTEEKLPGHHFVVNQSDCPGVMAWLRDNCSEPFKCWHQYEYVGQWGVRMLVLNILLGDRDALLFKLRW